MSENNKIYSDLVGLLRELQTQIDDIKQKNTNSSETGIKTFLLNIDFHKFIIGHMVETPDLKIYLKCLKDDFGYAIHDLAETICPKLQKILNIEKDYQFFHKIRKTNLNIGYKIELINELSQINKMIFRSTEKQLIKDFLRFDTNDYENASFERVYDLWEALISKGVVERSSLEKFLKKENFDLYKSPRFSKDVNPVYEYLQNPLIWNNNFEQYYTEKLASLKNEYQTSQEVKAKNYYSFKVRQLYTYKIMLEFYNYIKKLDIIRLIIARYIFDFDEILKGNKKNVEYVYALHFSKTKEEFQKIKFLFNKNNVQDIWFVNYLLWIALVGLFIGAIVFLDFWIVSLVMVAFLMFVTVRHFYNKVYGMDLRIPVIIRVNLIILLALLLINFGPFKKAPTQNFFDLGANILSHFGK